MMIRSFLPVGQGAFYCEQFGRRSGKERINIIYDCGSSSNEKYVKRQIKSNFEKGEVIHALFISHLDDDHTNGIPILLDHCKVKNMFFPLVTEADQKYLYLRHLVEGRGINSFAMALGEDPYRAFEQFHIEYIPVLHPVAASEQNIQQAYRRMDAQPVYSGGNVAHTIFGNAGGEYRLTRDWLYIPYNFRQPERLHQLQNALYMEFGREVDDMELSWIWEKGPDEKREKIKRAYQTVKGSLNTNSMTLYSGLSGDHEYRQRTAINRCLCEYSCVSKAAGCLYTGDYDASGVKKWHDLQDAYKDCWGQIGCIQVPHHGSYHNYNTELAELNAYYIISAGRSNRYNHPHGIVIKDLLFHGQHPHIVTEHQASTLQLCVY